MIGFLVFGLVVGILARLLLPGRQRIGLALTLLLGVLGSVVGGTVASWLGTGDIWELNTLGAVVAVLTSVGLLAVADAAGIGAREQPRSLPPGRGRPER